MMSMTEAFIAYSRITSDDPATVSGRIQHANEGELKWLESTLNHMSEVLLSSGYKTQPSSAVSNENPYVRINAKWEWVNAAMTAAAANKPQLFLENYSLIDHRALELWGITNFDEKDAETFHYFQQYAAHPLLWPKTVREAVLSCQPTATGILEAVYHSYLYLNKIGCRNDNICAASDYELGQVYQAALDVVSSHNAADEEKMYAICNVCRYLIPSTKLNQLSCHAEVLRMAQHLQSKEVPKMKLAIATWHSITSQINL